MVSRVTPFRRLRYPFNTNVVDPVDIQKLATDIDGALNTDDKLRTDAFRRSGATVARTGSNASFTKNTLTTVTWDSGNPNNGANGGFGTAAWWSSTTNPSRLTAPTACLVYAAAYVQLDATAGAMGTNGYFELMIAKNGATAQPQIQAHKYPAAPGSSTSAIEASVESLWSLAAGDYLEAKGIWNGTPAGPLLSVPFPSMDVWMIAVP